MIKVYITVDLRLVFRIQDHREGERVGLGRYRPIIGVVGLSVLITIVSPAPICNPGTPKPAIEPGLVLYYTTLPRTPLPRGPSQANCDWRLPHIYFLSALAHIPIQNPTFLSHLLTLISLNHQLSVPREAPDYNDTLSHSSSISPAMLIVPNFPTSY